eukprot:537276-Prymnesium_polylepis.1
MAAGGRSHARVSPASRLPRLHNSCTDPRRFCFVWGIRCSALSCRARGPQFGPTGRPRSHESSRSTCCSNGAPPRYAIVALPLAPFIWAWTRSTGASIRARTRNTSLECSLRSWQASGQEHTFDWRLPPSGSYETLGTHVTGDAYSSPRWTHPN